MFLCLWRVRSSSVLADLQTYHLIILINTSDDFDHVDMGKTLTNRIKDLFKEHFSSSLSLQATSGHQDIVFVLPLMVRRPCCRPSTTMMLTRSRLSLSTIWICSHAIGRDWPSNKLKPRDQRFTKSNLACLRGIAPLSFSTCSYINMYKYTTLSGTFVVPQSAKNIPN